MNTNSSMNINMGINSNPNQMNQNMWRQINPNMQMNNPSMLNNQIRPQEEYLKQFTTALLTQSIYSQPQTQQQLMQSQFQTQNMSNQPLSQSQQTTKIKERLILNMTNEER